MIQHPIEQLSAQTKIGILKDTKRALQYNKKTGLCLQISNYLTFDANLNMIEDAFRMDIIRPSRPGTYWWSFTWWGNWRRRRALNKLNKYCENNQIKQSNDNY